MNCEELRDQYELYVLGVADEAERSEIRAHLDRECKVCMLEVKRALEMATLLGGTAPAAEPSPMLRERILSSVGIRKRRFQWAPLWAAAAAALLIATIYLAGREREFVRETSRLRQDIQLRIDEIARLNEAFAILAGHETREASFGNTQPLPPRGRVFLNPRQGVLLIASNLPPAPAGKLYEMWVIPKGNKPVPAGLFQSRPDGSAMHVRPGSVDVERTGAVAVTVENEAGADQPTTQPLIVAPLTGGQR